MFDKKVTKQEMSDETLARLGRDMCSALVKNDLDQSLFLLLDHAEMTGYKFSDETRRKLFSNLELL